MVRTLSQLNGRKQSGHVEQFSLHNRVVLAGMDISPILDCASVSAVAEDAAKGAIMKRGSTDPVAELLTNLGAQVVLLPSDRSTTNLAKMARNVCWRHASSSDSVDCLNRF